MEHSLLHYTVKLSLTCLTLAGTFLRDLGSEDISQRFLAEKLESHSKPERPPEGSARFLDSGYYATRGNFRDIDDFTNPCILSDDKAAVEKLINDKETYDAFVVSVPMPSKKDAPIWILEESPGWLPKHLRIADSKFYREHYGFVADLDLLKDLEETDK